MLSVGTGSFYNSLRTVGGVRFRVCSVLGTEIWGGIDFRHLTMGAVFSGLGPWNLIFDLTDMQCRA